VRKSLPCLTTILAYSKHEVSRASLFTYTQVLGQLARSWRLAYVLYLFTLQSKKVFEAFRRNLFPHTCSPYRMKPPNPKLPSSHPRDKGQTHFKQPKKIDFKFTMQEKQLQTLGRAGGMYIPPARLKQMQQQITDKNSIEYQRLTWEALRKSINGLCNKMTAANIKNIIPELFAENLIRGSGLFCRSIMKAQAASPTFTPGTFRP
jgi:hypothetical protein